MVQNLVSFGRVIDQKDDYTLVLLHVTNLSPSLIVIYCVVSPEIFYYLLNKVNSVIKSILVNFSLLSHGYRRRW